MEPYVFAAMMLGAIPALILMFYMLRPFEGAFDERSTLFSFVIGMVVGTLVGVLHGQIDPFAISHPINAVLIFVLGFAVFDQFMRVVVLNLPRFSGQTQTTFYGTAFGLGYGSMLTALWFYRTFVDSGLTVNAWVALSFLAASFAFAVVHGSTGMLIGFGATERIVWRFGLLGVGMESVLNFLWYLALFASYLYDIWELVVMSMLLAALYGIILLRWVMNRIVPDLLPKDAQRGRRRLLRRKKRAQRS